MDEIMTCHFWFPFFCKVGIMLFKRVKYKRTTYWFTEEKMIITLAR